MKPRTLADDQDHTWQTEDELIFIFNSVLFWIYCVALTILLRLISLKNLRYPLRLYVVTYLVVFTWRLIDGTMILFFINRDAVGQNIDGYLYFATNSIHTIVDRFTVLVMIHFVFQMWAVKTTLECQTFNEQQIETRKQKLISVIVYSGFAVFQSVILGCRIYSIYYRYVKL